MNTFLIKEKISFYFSSRRLHGVHSPLVYGLVSELSKKNSVQFQRVIPFINESRRSLVNKVIDYLKRENISLNQVVKLEKIDEQCLNNREYNIVLGIRKNRDDFQKWKKYVNNSNTIQLDFFDFAFVIRRDEQAPEYFYLWF